VGTSWDFQNENPFPSVGIHYLVLSHIYEKMLKFRKNFFDLLLSSYPNFGRESKAMVVASNISYKIYKKISSSNHYKIEVLLP
jgi:hypothetical protein